MVVFTNAENRIAKEFFLEFTTGSEVSRKLYPNSFSKSKISKRKNVGIVSNFFSKCSKKGYFDSKKIKKEKTSNRGTVFEYELPTYRLNLNFFFDYAKEILGKREFTKKEKGFLRWIFSNKNVRKLSLNYTNILDGIIQALDKIFTQMDPEHPELIGEQFLKEYLFKEKWERDYFKVNKFFGDLDNKIVILSKREERDMILEIMKEVNYRDYPSDVVFE